VAGEAVEAVLRAVDDDGDREETERAEAEECAQVRDPLAVAQGGDCDADRDPDEHDLEDVVAEAPVPDRKDIRPPRVGEMKASEPPTHSGLVTQ
jgi:hypothetical protein